HLDGAVHRPALGRGNRGARGEPAVRPHPLCPGGKGPLNNPKNFTDLFVYNYERPYPFELVQRPILIFGSRTLTGGDVLALVMIAAGGYLLLETVAAKKPAVLPRAMALLVGLGGAAVLVSTVARGRLPPMFFVGVALALVALYLAWEAGRSERE